MRILLTNDDGIEAEGLQTLRRALLKLPDVSLAVVAPDGNRSAVARSITTRRPLWVQEIQFADGGTGYATDGTPVDCVRLANIGLLGGWRPELVVSGINHGSNLGDDITYSGTVAAALEAVILGVPGIAVSQQSGALELDFRQSVAFDFGAAADFTARLVADLDMVPLSHGTLLNVNFPGTTPEGVEVARLGKRVYTDELELIERSGSRSCYQVYGQAAKPGLDERDSDVAAIARHWVAVTPLHFDLTYHDGVAALVDHDLQRLLAPSFEDGRWAPSAPTAWRLPQP